MNRVMNLPERSLELATAFRQKWFWMWVLLPIVAFYVSSVFMFMIFPRLLVGFQWIALEANSRKIKTTIWLLNVITLAITIGIVWSIEEFFTFQKHLFIAALVIYYVLQIFNEALLCKIFKKWRYGYWTLANTLSCLLWVGMCVVVSDNINVQISFMAIPLIGIITNIITGLGIHLATQSRYGV